MESGILFVGKEPAAKMTAVLSMGFWYLREPLAVSHHGDDDVEAIESCLERDALRDIEITAHGIDDDPEHPLLDILPCQCPQAYEAQGISERVHDGHGGVGVVGEDVPRGAP